MPDDITLERGRPLTDAELLRRADWIRLRTSEPNWPDRDRFLLGKGHVATGLWPVLADLGFYPQDWLKQFGKVGSPLNDHPNMKVARGIDFSSGSLGHNMS